MPGVTRARSINALAALLLLACVSAPTWAQIRFDLPAQPLAQALTSIGSLANLNVYFDPSLVDGRQAPALKADLTADEALTRLLAGTQLHAVRVDANTVRVVAEPAEKRAQSTHAAETGAIYSPSNTHLAYADGSQGVDVQAQQRLAATDSTQTRDAHPERIGLAEVIVSAQKRTERLQDVPVPVTAIDADALVDQNQMRLQDYYSGVPGLSLSSAGHGDATLSMRGVTTGGYTNPTVGVTVDDVPMGTSIALGSRTAAPDFDPSDLRQIEVLRGPQGTLYGASSIGGLLKYETVDPSTTEVRGRAQADLTGVQHGDGLGFGVHGAVNLPLNDQLAMRASAFTRRDPGYIADPVLGNEGVNQAKVYGGHLAGLWRPSDLVSVKLSALFQETSANGSSYSTLQPGLTPLQQIALKGTGGYNHKLTAYAANINASVGPVKIVSITGYSIDTFSGVNDLTPFYGGAGGPADLTFGVTGSDQLEHNETRKFSQELRLSGSVGERLDWLLGGFYTHEDTPTHDVYRAVDPAAAQVAGILLDDSYPTTYAEYAAFGDLTIRLTDRFDVQFGARESQNRQSYQETYTGPLVPFFGLPSSPAINPPVHTKDNSFTYLVTPRIKLSSDVMVYARLASGYRPGGPNPTCTLFPTPCEYQPDKTRNYELGLKGETPDHRFSFDGSVYYINWKDIQLQAFNAAGVYYTNASSARSQGVELSVRAQPLERLTISAWLALNDAKLTSSLPPNSTAVGNSGDRLPYTSRISGGISFDKDWRLTDSTVAFAGGSLNYVGNRQDNFASQFNPGQARFVLPGYAQENARAGIRYDTWTFSLFINNLSDKRGILTYPQIGLTTYGITYIQPRTGGLSVARSF